ncbi:hypothetical protein AEGHOMDF_0121 [Methylobacterium soli]|nr:hypothetical protein AEGHOMDF_0121 [Methylobacterium soli]
MGPELGRLDARRSVVRVAEAVHTEAMVRRTGDPLGEGCLAERRDRRDQDREPVLLGEGEQGVEAWVLGDGVVVAPPQRNRAATLGRGIEGRQQGIAWGARPEVSTNAHGVGGKGFQDGDRAGRPVEIDPVIAGGRRGALGRDGLDEGPCTEVGLRQHPGEAARGEAFGPGALLGLAAGLEGDEDGPGARCQKVGCSVVTRLADGHSGSGEERPEVRPGPRDGAGGQALAERGEIRLRQSLAHQDAPAPFRPQAGGLGGGAVEPEPGRARSARDHDARPRRARGRHNRALVDIAGVVQPRPQGGVDGPGGVEGHEAGIAVDQDGVVEFRDPPVRRLDLARLIRGDEDVADRGDHEGARTTRPRGLDQSQEFRREAAASEGEQLGDHEIGRAFRQGVEQPGLPLRQGLAADGLPVGAQERAEGGAAHLHGRKLNRLDAVEPDEGDREAAGDQGHPVAGSGEGSGEGRRAREVPGPEKMRHRDQDPQAHAASGA